MEPMRDAWSGAEAPQLSLMSPNMSELGRMSVGDVGASASAAEHGPL